MSAADLLSSEVDERLVAKAALDAAEENLKTLCASHASTFVSVERRGAKLEALLRDLQTNISSISENNVSSSQELLQEDTLSKLSENHRLRRRTLLQHSALLELLELPSLMDACVRSHLYQEALQIASFSSQLKTSENSVVQKVVQQVHSRQVDLQRHLLSRLKQQVTMPVCLEIVTSLKRLNNISNTSGENAELKLQLDFLEARDVWLATGISKGEGFFDSIEQYRARVFEIATQFQAIFGASSGVDSTLLSMWMCRRVDSFLTMLEQHKFQDSASLRDAWEASIFFSNSMGRLGADFTPLLGEVFEGKMKDLILNNYWKDAVSTLEETLNICRHAGVASPLISNSTTSTIMVENSIADGQPPRLLLTLPPLARFVNSILEGLNELRRCLFPGLFGVLREELNEILTETKSILETHERAVRAPGLRGEATQLREVALLLLERMDAIVDPYLRGALELALGDVQKAQGYLEQVQKVMASEEEEVEEEVEDEQDEEERVDDVQEDSEVGQEQEPEGEDPKVTEEDAEGDDPKAVVLDEEALGTGAPQVTDDEANQEDVGVPPQVVWDQEELGNFE